MAALTSFAIGSLIAGTALNAAGQIRAGRQAKQIGEFNAQVAEEQAVDALRRGAEEVNVFRRTLRSTIGRQRAGYAGAGVDVHTGSAAQVRLDAERLAMSDMLRIRRNAEREAHGYRIDAQNARLGAGQASSAARYGAASTIIGGSSLLLTRIYGPRAAAAASDAPA